MPISSILSNTGHGHDSDLLPVLSPAAVQALDEVGGVAQEHGVAGGAADHAQHRQPHVRQGLGREPEEADTFKNCLSQYYCNVSSPSISDTQHVWHRLEINW